MYRFHRATPRGTAYSAAETAAVVQNANVFSPVIATGTRGNARPEEVLFASSSEAPPPDGSEPPSPWVAGAREAAEAAEARTTPPGARRAGEAPRAAGGARAMVTTRRDVTAGRSRDPGPDPDPGLDRAYAETIATRPGGCHRRDAHARGARARGCRVEASRRSAAKRGRSGREMRSEANSPANRDAIVGCTAAGAIVGGVGGTLSERGGGGRVRARARGSRRGSVGSRRRERARARNEPKTTRSRDDTRRRRDRRRPRRRARGRSRPPARGGEAVGARVRAEIGARRGPTDAGETRLPPPRRHAPNRQKNQNRTSTVGLLHPRSRKCGAPKGAHGPPSARARLSLSRECPCGDTLPASSSAVRYGPRDRARPGITSHRFASRRRARATGKKPIQKTGKRLSASLSHMLGRWPIENEHPGQNFETERPCMLPARRSNRASTG